MILCDPFSIPDDSPFCTAIRATVEYAGTQNSIVLSDPLKEAQFFSWAREHLSFPPGDTPNVPDIWLYLHLNFLRGSGVLHKKKDRLYLNRKFDLSNEWDTLADYWLNEMPHLFLSAFVRGPLPGPLNWKAIRNTLKQMPHDGIFRTNLEDLILQNHPEIMLAYPQILRPLLWVGVLSVVSADPDPDYDIYMSGSL